VHEVEGQWNEEADKVCGSDPLVAGADGKHLGGDRPSDGKGVELLNVCAGPNAGTFDRDKDCGLVLNDTV
jgi:hypothetical protein